jgi:hypothetical protein
LGETAMSADGNAREDKLAIIEVIQNWALWRDGGDWERLRGAFHPEGTMTATWFSGPADEFIAKASRGVGCRRPRRPFHRRLERSSQWR